MTDDAMERVARAMYVAHARWAEPYLSEAWPPEAEETRDLYLTLARAALAEVADPLRVGAIAREIAALHPPVGVMVIRDAAGQESAVGCWRADLCPKWIAEIEAVILRALRPAPEETNDG